MLIGRWASSSDYSHCIKKAIQGPRQPNRLESIMRTHVFWGKGFPRLCFKACLKIRIEAGDLRGKKESQQ